MKIHDGHVHIIEDAELFGRDMTFTWEELVQHLGKVSRVQLMPAMEKNDNSRIVNSVFFKTLQRFYLKDRVWAFYWPHPHQTTDYFIKNHTVSGIKYHPSVSQLKVHQAKAVLDLCEDYSLPLLVHCGRNAMSRIEFCLQAYRERNITLIAAHLGGVSPPLISRALQLLERTSDLDNFYLDTSSVDVARLIARAINVIGPKHIIFGTDIPFHEYPVLRYSTQQVWERDDVDVSSEDMRDILYRNLERIHCQT